MKHLFLAIAIFGLASCSTPTTEKPSEAVTVNKVVNRYYFEFNKLTETDFDTIAATIPDRYLSFDEVKSFRDAFKVKSLGRACNYDAQRADFYDYFVPMGNTVKEIDEWMDRVDARGNGLFWIAQETGYKYSLYVEVQ
jgi:hypothetical protein